MLSGFAQAADAEMLALSDGIARSGDGGVSFPKGFTASGIDWPQPDCEGTMRKVAAVSGAECTHQPLLRSLGKRFFVRVECGDQAGR